MGSWGLTLAGGVTLTLTLTLRRKHRVMAVALTYHTCSNSIVANPHYRHAIDS